MPPIDEHFTVYRGDDRNVVFTGKANGSASGWTVVFTARSSQKAPDPPALSVPATVTDPGSATTPAVFTVPLTKALLLALQVKPYLYSLKRTNVGAATTLREGQMTVKADILNP